MYLYKRYRQELTICAKYDKPIPLTKSYSVQILDFHWISLINFLFIYMGAHEIDLEIERGPGSKKFENHWSRDLPRVIADRNGWWESQRNICCQHTFMLMKFSLVYSVTFIDWHYQRNNPNHKFSLKKWIGRFWNWYTGIEIDLLNSIKKYVYYISAKNSCR